MKQRGRVSGDAREIAMLAPVDATQRPDAPYDLTDEQAQEWWAIVNRMPADWFPRETHPLLAQFCRHIVAARHIAQLITKMEKAKSLDVSSYDKLLGMQEREGRAISSLATRMRISQQGSYDKKKSKGAIVVEQPWKG